MRIGDDQFHNAITVELSYRLGKACVVENEPTMSPIVGQFAYRCDGGSSVVVARGITQAPAPRLRHPLLRCLFHLRTVH